MGLFKTTNEDLRNDLKAMEARIYATLGQMQRNSRNVELNVGAARGDIASVEAQIGNKLERLITRTEGSDQRTATQAVPDPVEYSQDSLSGTCNCEYCRSNRNETRGETSRPAYPYAEEAAFTEKLRAYYDARTTEPDRTYPSAPPQSLGEQYGQYAGLASLGGAMAQSQASGQTQGLAGVSTGRYVTGSAMQPVQDAWTSYNNVEDYGTGGPNPSGSTATTGFAYNIADPLGLSADVPEVLRGPETGSISMGIQSAQPKESIRQVLPGSGTLTTY